MRSLCAVTGFTSLAFLASPLAAQNVGLQLQNGVDQFVDVAYTPAILPPSGITLEAWATYDDTTLIPGWVWPTIARQNVGAGLESYFLRIAAGNTNSRVVVFNVHNQNGTVGSASWAFASGQLLPWTHYAGTFDGQTVRLFINGQEVGSAPLTGRVRDQGGVLRIGKGDDAVVGGETWNGQIDEVRLWPYARTAAEIQATMNQELMAVPGGVSTWNFNNDFRDSSGGLHGTVSGGVGFANNPLALQTLPVSGGFPFGSSPPTCNAAVLRSSITTRPHVGTSAFAIATTRAAANAQGGLLITFAALPAAFPFLGIDLWVNPSASGFLVSVGAGATGYARLGLPIPSTPSIAGGTLYSQFVFVDACGPSGLVASDALRVVLLP
jgi:hypothetical protein